MGTSPKVSPSPPQSVAIGTAILEDDRGRPLALHPVRSVRAECACALGNVRISPHRKTLRTRAQEDIDMTLPRALPGSPSPRVGWALKFFSGSPRGGSYDDAVFDASLLTSILAAVADKISCEISRPRRVDVDDDDDDSRSRPSSVDPIERATFSDRETHAASHSSGASIIATIAWRIVFVCSNATYLHDAGVVAVRGCGRRSWIHISAAAAARSEIAACSREPSAPPPRCRRPVRREI